MAQIVLSQAGATLGAAALPSGLTVFGQTLAGAAIGRAVGSLAGAAIDASLAPPIEGPRVKSLHVMESREGAGLPTVYGRMRVGGQVIWASRFREKRKSRSAGKGGPKVTEFSYTVSFAVALCEGPITRVDRIWANGELQTLAGLNWRLYTGTPDQLPDPLMEAIEGTGQVPAYRDTAYIVFEDFPLDAFGQRLPQLSFEVVRAGTVRADSLRSVVNGVNIIPATGEFVYGTQIVRERRFPGIERALNMNNSDGRADFAVSVEQMKSDLPGMAAAALTVAWFADGVTAGTAKVRPGVETRERGTVPYGWRVDTAGRGDAHLISGTADAANFGGTPADTAVLEGIAALSEAGLAVTLSPFMLVDAPGFPWRGRITVSADKTAAARAEIDAFVGADGGFGFRHFILHHARLAAQSAQAGYPVDAILLGSEMVGVSRVRDATGAFPFVEALVSLASEVRAIVGPGVKISYAADWTEYGAYVPGDGRGDVLFPLDALWASPDLDFVGVDWYPPVGDWRDGDQHLDALAGFTAADDPDYLLANMAGGEAFDWFYADSAARDAQVRTPIVDSAHGEHWVFRAKDLGGWWAAAHHPRPAGVRSATPTAWTPGQKPVRLIEIGFPAVDRGGNAPNLFFDPKSSESALPPYSTGARDDLFQRRALVSALDFWTGQAFVDQALVWAWDGRPWPDYPVRNTIWSDGPNWQFGHWLNGRTGLIELSDVIEDLAERADVSLGAGTVSGFVEGYAIDGVTTLRQALSPLEAAFDLNVRELEGRLEVSMARAHLPIAVPAGDIVEQSQTETRGRLDKVPGRLVLSYVSGTGSYEPATAEARHPSGDPTYALRLTMPMVMNEARADALAADLLATSVEARSAGVSLGPANLMIEPGDLVSDHSGKTWRVEQVDEAGLQRDLALVPPRTLSGASRFIAPGGGGDIAWAPAAGELVLIDGPALPGLEPGRPVLAVTADPWPRREAVLAGPDVSGLSERAVVRVAARMGQLLQDLPPGPVGRWDEASRLNIKIVESGFQSRPPLATLNGEGLLLIQRPVGWELLSYRQASLVGTDTWQLSGLLRGLAGSSADGASAGSIVVEVDEALVAAGFSPDETGLDLVWQAGSGDVHDFRFDDLGGLAWSVAHLRARLEAGDWSVSWVRRGGDISDSWALPEAANDGEFRVESFQAGTLLSQADVSGATALVPGQADLVRVAEIGNDGRLGVWTSIPLNAA